MGRVGTNLVALDPCDDAGFEEYPKLEDFRVTAIPNLLLLGARNFRRIEAVTSRAVSYTHLTLPTN